VFSSGIISYDSATDYPGLVEVFGKCYYDPKASDARLFQYMSNFDQAKFDAQLLS